MQNFLKKILFLFVVILFVGSELFAAQRKDQMPFILVSVAPHKFFVEKIAKDTVQVYLMVPAGASAHTYEPSPRQMLIASQANIWFRMGESFECRAIQALTSHHPELKMVDLRQGVNLIQSDARHKGCCEGSADLHFWLSAREAQRQAQTIADTLISVFPENTKIYQNNLEAFQRELIDLDHEIQTILTPLKKRQILVSHPAYAYFCRDYELEQYAIEVEGKDPTPQQMTKLLNTARHLDFRTIFIQMQYNNKAAKLVAETLGARLITIDPYSEQYMTSMQEIAHAFAKQ